MAKPDRTAVLEAQVASLMAERGIPVDPVDAALKALLAHVKVRRDANPGYDFSELQKQLDAMQEDGVTTAKASLVEALLRRGIRRELAPIAHELAYVVDLAEDLSVAVLEHASSAVTETVE